MVCRIAYGKSEAKLTITYERCRVIKVELALAGQTGNTAEKLESDPFKINILNYN